MLTRRMLVAALTCAAISGHSADGLGAGLSIEADHHNRAFSCRRPNRHDRTHRIRGDECVSGSVRDC